MLEAEADAELHRARLTVAAAKRGEDEEIRQPLIGAERHLTGVAEIRRVEDVEQLEVRVDRLQHGEFQRSEEHTSELQSRFDLVCRLLLEKKKITTPCLSQHPLDGSLEDGSAIAFELGLSLLESCYHCDESSEEYLVRIHETPLLFERCKR